MKVASPNHKCQLKKRYLPFFKHISPNGVDKCCLASLLRLAEDQAYIKICRLNIVFLINFNQNGLKGAALLAQYQYRVFIRLQAHLNANNRYCSFFNQSLPNLVDRRSLASCTNAKCINAQINIRPLFFPCETISTNFKV